MNRRVHVSRFTLQINSNCAFFNVSNTRSGMVPHKAKFVLLRISKDLRAGMISLRNAFKFKTGCL